MNKLIQMIAMSASLWFLSACNTVPKAVKGDYAHLSIAEVRQSQSGQQVRWGGVIAQTDNKDNYTLIEVVSKPLNSSTRPQNIDATTGRFIARVQGFIDPIIYKKGREITVVGNISELKQGKIGDMEYMFPVVNVDGYHLWKKRQVYDNSHHYHHSIYWGGYPYFFPYYYTPYHWHPHPHRRSHSSGSSHSNGRNNNANNNSARPRPKPAAPRPARQPRSRQIEKPQRIK